ncbi:MAG TPA: hydroxymethylbilane synthase [Methyloceanibacter sp.]|nr:hydroxymethylbilane synthase [Methyloceanibacter sp.]
MPSRFLQIGTRGSPLALWQARHVQALLAAAHGLAGEAIALKVITTSGDRITDKPLRGFGGKGLFTKEIDEALLDGSVDLAVHSMKDLPTRLPDGLTIAAVLPRADVRDAFISTKAGSLADLPPGAIVGTSSLRRAAQVGRRRPDLRVIDFRGNVETRLKKLGEGKADATLLALAGLERLGLAAHATSILSTEEMLPAVAQGAIGVTCRTDDDTTRALLDALNDATSATAIACERAFLARLDGSCKTPIAGLAEIENGQLRFRGMILTPDGSAWFETERTEAASRAERIGTEAGEALLQRAGPTFLSSLV